MIISIDVKAAELQKWRERIGLTREQLARELRTSYPTVYRWEEGQRKIPPYLDLALETIERRLKEQSH
jgi:DNA-binding transcriptional regulator YiaG